MPKYNFATYIIYLTRSQLCITCYENLSHYKQTHYKFRRGDHITDQGME